MATRQIIQGRTNQSPPWEPVAVEKAEITAIQALVSGLATKDQQGLFVEWLKRATAIGELEFRATGERESTFAAGKRFVGLQFFTLAKASLPDPKHGQ